MIIRTAKPKDLPVLLNIYNHEILSGVATLDLNVKSLPEWTDWFNSHATAKHPLILAEIDSQATGYACLSTYRDKEAYDSTVELSVYIDHRYRNMGIASALMDNILQRAKADLSTHTVVSVITAGNAASTKLHDKFGFEYCGTIREVGFKFGKYQDIENYQLSV